MFATLVDTLSGLVDLLIVVLGFSAIIVVHELGHYLAARWAGIRVLAFAVGFGPALVSYRKGLGFRRGSSAAEHAQLVRTGPVSAAKAVSPTEYRLNALPFGGYVKMLGQDDADPGAVSSEPDSYNTAPVWKRMVVISAGVAANLVTAALLFIVVFRSGLETEPAKIGEVLAGRPAASVIAVNAKDAGVREPGLKPGDEVISLDGRRPNHFNDLVMHLAMSREKDPVEMLVRRPGVNETLKFAIIPDVDRESRMLGIGVRPKASGTIITSKSSRDRDAISTELTARGLGAIEPGMKIVKAGGAPAASLYDLQKAMSQAGGKPVEAEFQNSAGKTVKVSLSPQPELEMREVEGARSIISARHLVGLLPVLKVADVTPGTQAAEVGLKPGDIFVQLGSREWPSLPSGITEIREHKQQTLKIIVARPDADGQLREVKLPDARVSSEGTIGFTPDDTASSRALLSTWPSSAKSGPIPSGAGLPIPPGSRIVSVNGTPVANLGEVRNALLALKGETRPNYSATATLIIELPMAQGLKERSQQSIDWTLSAEELDAVAALGWESPLDARFFERETFEWKAKSTLDAVGMGLSETRRVMAMTYLTFARLFQGSVKVEHLKGPVGIAHVGVVVADRGLLWTLFFFALISVNLAVVNFLPIPIADGGHMVFLIYERITGRPPPVAVQNIAAIAGLILLGSMFLYVTLADVGNAAHSLTRFFSR